MFKIYVGNISYKTPEQTLAKLFGTYGLVDEVIYVTDDETGKPRGFAFVLMADENQGRAAISALNGRPVNGRRLAVSEATRRKKKVKEAAPRPTSRRPTRGARANRFSSRPMRRDRR